VKVKIKRSEGDSEEVSGSERRIQKEVKKVLHTESFIYPFEQV